MAFCFRTGRDEPGAAFKRGANDYTVRELTAQCGLSDKHCRLTTPRCNMHAAGTDKKTKTREAYLGALSQIVESVLVAPLIDALPFR